MDVVAWDSLGSIATVGVFGPALVLVGLVVFAVVRDRRRNPRTDDDDADHVDDELTTPPPAPPAG